MSLQDLETDFAATRAEAARIRERMLADQDPLTPQRLNRMQTEKADGLVTRLDEIVNDRAAAIALGKAFFWDQQVGSDGQTACASCHFRAGTDGRHRSLGMAARMLTEGPVAAEGLEPSDPLDQHLMLLVYLNRWRSMVDFQDFLSRLVKRALDRLRIRLPAIRMSIGVASRRKWKS